MEPSVAPFTRGALTAPIFLARKFSLLIQKCVASRASMIHVPWMRFHAQLTHMLRVKQTNAQNCKSSWLPFIYFGTSTALCGQFPDIARVDSSAEAVTTMGPFVGSLAVAQAHCQSLNMNLFSMLTNEDGFVITALAGSGSKYESHSCLRSHCVIFSGTSS